MKTSYFEKYFVNVLLWTSHNFVVLKPNIANKIVIGAKLAE